MHTESSIQLFSSCPKPSLLFLTTTIVMLLLVFPSVVLASSTDSSTQDRVQVDVQALVSHEQLHHPQLSLAPRHAQFGQWRSLFLMLFGLLMQDDGSSLADPDMAIPESYADSESYAEQEARILAKLEEAAETLPETLLPIHEEAMQLFAEVQTEHEGALQLLDSPDYQALLAQIGEANEALTGIATDEEMALLETWLVPVLKEDHTDVWKTYDKLQSGISTQRSIYRNAGYGSKAETDALAEIERLNQEIGLLVADIYPEFSDYQRIQSAIEEEEERYLDADYDSPEEAAAVEAKADLQREIISLLTPIFPDYSEYINLQIQLEEQNQIYLTADYGSKEEADAQLQVEALGVQAEALVARVFPTLVDERLALENQLEQLQQAAVEQFDQSFPALASLQDLQREIAEMSVSDDAGSDEQLRARLAGQLGKVNPEAYQEYQQIAAEIEGWDEIFWNANYGSEEEAKAQEEILALESQATALLVNVFPEYGTIQERQEQIDRLVTALDAEPKGRLIGWLAAKLKDLDGDSWEAFQEISAESEEQERIYWNAEYDSQAEADAQARIIELEQEATLLLADYFPQIVDFMQLQSEIAEQDALYWDAEAGSEEEATAQTRGEELQTEADALLVDVFPEFVEEEAQMQTSITQLETEKAALISEAFPAPMVNGDSQEKIELWVQLSAELEELVTEQNAELQYLIEP